MKNEITILIAVAIIAVAIGYMASHTEKVDTSECYLMEVER